MGGFPAVKFSHASQHHGVEKPNLLIGGVKFLQSPPHGCSLSVRQLRQFLNDLGDAHGRNLTATPAPFQPAF